VCEGGLKQHSFQATPGKEAVDLVDFPPEVHIESPVLQIKQNLSSDFILPGEITAIQHPLTPVGAVSQGNWESWQKIRANSWLVNTLYG
jgi:hypothetical protein